MDSRTHALASLFVIIPWKSLLQRLLGVWNLVFLLLCIAGPTHAPIAYALYYATLHMFFISNNLRTFWGVYQAYTGTITHSKTDWVGRYCEHAGVASPLDRRHDLPYSSISHTIIIPNYKETMDTLSDTLDVLASHEMALTHYKICLAMEEAEPNAENKARSLIRYYQDSFFYITFTLHPVGIPGETRGKSSNVSYASRQMAKLSGFGQDGNCNQATEILTVMDADTCFAQDYFTALSCHYACAKPEERNYMLFTPCTVFDRNAHNVPAPVRVADMLWSAGVMSNLYNGAALKFPCSAYSMPLSLAHAVGYWDTDSHSIGEDMHMFLKCFFATQGHLKMVTIYSPASQCNVQGDNFIHGVMDRYGQAKRHMWGSLDTGYMLRRLFFGVFAPGYDSPQNGVVTTVPLMCPSNASDNLFAPGGLVSKIPVLLHRLTEAHILMGQIFALVAIATLFPPEAGEHPYVVLATWLGGWVRFIFGISFVATLVLYEKYHQYVSKERWELSMQEQLRAGSGQGVQPLGKQSQLVSIRTWRHCLDWVCLPVTGLLYLTFPQFHAHILHLFTDKLDYTVAGKPPVVTHHHFAAPGTDLEANNPSGSIVASRSNNSLMSASTAVEEAFDSSSVNSRGDSGFYDFDPAAVKPGAPYSPSMWGKRAASSNGVYSSNSGYFGASGVAGGKAELTDLDRDTLQIPAHASVS